MEIVDVIIIMLITLIIGSIFYYGFGRRGPYGAFWIFLLLLFLAGLAGRLWITPAGPIIWGFAWLPLIFWIFILALIIGAAPSERDARVDAEKHQKRIISKSDVIRSQKYSWVEEERAAGAGAAAAFGIFFWLLLLLFFIAIIVGLWI